MTLTSINYKCPKCNVTLLPCLAILLKDHWEIRISFSAERVMRSASANFYYWKCPKCDMTFSSEIEHKHVQICNYIVKERNIRRKKGESGGT